MENEYQALRSEMLQWQERRFDLLKISISLVTALLGLKLMVEPVDQRVVWPLVSALLLLFLASANLLTWYAARANSKLAGYIQVFHERERPGGQGWERRLEALKKTKFSERLSLNTWTTAIYLVLALVATGVPWAMAGFAWPGVGACALLAGSAGAFLASLLLSLFFSYDRRYYVELWSAIKQGEPPA